MSSWSDVCALNDIHPGTGVCALVGERQVAIFRPHAEETLFALDNIDPFGQASVLSRGLIAEHEGELWVASPLKKQRFRLRDGYCRENEQYSREVFPVRVENGRVLIDQPCYP